MDRARRLQRPDDLPPECRPIAPLLPALPDDELSPAEAARVRAHLAVCPRCREEAQAFRRLGALLREQSVPEVELPAGAQAVAWIERAARHSSTIAGNGRIVDAGVPRPQVATFFRRLAAVKAALAVLMAGAGLVAWRSFYPANASWAVVPLAGAPKVGAAPVGANGRLGVGEWLETDSRSVARIDIGEIGQVKIEPNTRLRLLEARPREQRLSLTRGVMHARLTAPPRLFFVETPSAVAVDLGCEYTLAVNGAGRSFLRVARGQVAFELDGRETVVPAGAHCETRPRIGPGTPAFDDAPAPLRTALERYDFEKGGAPALASVLAAARRRDAFTLWHLLARVPSPEWDRVYNRLAALVPPPPGVTREGVRRQDPVMLGRWRVDVEDTWWN